MLAPEIAGYSRLDLESKGYINRRRSFALIQRPERGIVSMAWHTGRNGMVDKSIQQGAGDLGTLGRARNGKLFCGGGGSRVGLSPGDLIDGNINPQP